MVQVVRIAPLRAANIVGLIYLLLFGAIALAVLPLAGSIPANPKMDMQQQQAMHSMFRGMVIAYPLLGGASGWLMTLVGTFVYNLLAPRIGGIAVEFSDGSGAAHPAA